MFLSVFIWPQSCIFNSVFTGKVFGTRYLFLHDTINTVFSYINTFLLFIQGQLSNYHYCKSFHNKFRVCFKYYRHQPFRSILQDRVSGVFLTNIKRSEGLICEHKKKSYLFETPVTETSIYSCLNETLTLEWWCLRTLSLFVLRFYGPVNPMGSCRARSIYLATPLLGRLSPLSG